MEHINSRDGRWSISLCTCSEDTIHFMYGNATLHISIEDIRDLGMALQKVDEALKFRNGSNEEKKRSLH